MATNLTFLYWNNLWITGAALTADQADANFPASNLPLDSRSQVWRSTDASSGHYIQADIGTSSLLGSTTAVCVIDQNTNGGGGNELNLKGSNAVGMVPTTYDSSVATIRFPASSTALYHPRLRMYYWKITGGATSSRYWRITTNAAPALDAFTSFGKLFIGSAYAVPKNYSWGITFADQDFTERKRSSSAVMSCVSQRQAMRVTFTIKYMSISDSLGLKYLLENGWMRHSPVIALFDPDNDATGYSTGFVYYGYVVDHRFRREAGNTFTHDVVFEEQ